MTALADMTAFAGMPPYLDPAFVSGLTHCMAHKAMHHTEFSIVSAIIHKNRVELFEARDA